MVHFLYFIVSEDAFTVGVKEGLHEIFETVICIVCFHYLIYVNNQTLSRKIFYFILTLFCNIVKAYYT